METKTIITDLEQLQTRADEVDWEAEEEQVRQIAREMKEVIKENNLISLSAPQIGYNKRIICIAYADDEIKTYINPVIVHREGLHPSIETCSSIPGKTYLICRNDKVDVYFNTLRATIGNARFIGITAEVIQHACEHLDGITLDTFGLEVDDDFINAKKKEQQEIIKLYVEHIKQLKEFADNAVKDDDIAFRISEAIRFEEALANGTITLMPVEEEVKNDEDTTEKN